MQQMMRTTDVSALLPNVLELLVLNPGDGVRYRVASSLIRADPATRFFAIAREDEALVGDIFTLEPEVPFVAYIERMAEFHDLELLWAGWRVFLYLCGRADQEPPGDLPHWRSDWYASLAALPIVTYQLMDGAASRIVTIQRISPVLFTATSFDAQGWRCEAVAPCADLPTILERVQDWLQGHRYDVPMLVDTAN